MNSDETFESVQFDAPEEQRRYLRRLKWRHPAQTRSIDPSHLQAVVHEGLKLCPALNIDDPKDVLRFIALSVLVTAEQRNSTLLRTVAQRILLSKGTWSATKRLNFIYQHVLHHPPPMPEPDYGTWFITDAQ